jgi:4-hydroxybenzoate polyprenyltransferase
LKKIIHFFRLVRWNNLVFILLAEFLFHFCIYKPLYPLSGSPIDKTFYLVALTNILIAAAGYIINDYFDVNIDQVNKPQKVVVGSHISRRWVIFSHLFFSIVAVYIAALVFPFKQYWHIHLSNLLAILLLWFYSTNFKKDLLIGNIVISLLTAWSIAVVYFSKFTMQEILHPLINDTANFRFAKLMMLYSVFAFILTLVREALKDMEDIEGDQKFGCKTLPIVWGLMPTKIYISVWLVVVIACLSIIQLYVIPFGWWYSILYCISFIIAPLTIVLFKLKNSFTSSDFRKLSAYAKFAMLAGILSMLFFYFLF